MPPPPLLGWMMNGDSRWQPGFKLLTSTAGMHSFDPKSGADWVQEEARRGESQEGPNMIDPIEFGLKLSCVNHIIFLSLDSTEEPLTKSMQVGQKEPSKRLFFPNV